MNKHSPKLLNTVLKYAQYILAIFLILAAVYIFFKTPMGVAFAIETVGKDFGISTSPSSSFLKTTNMAPGDRISADLSVYNDGKLDFSYAISAYQASGDELLYNALELIIKDAGQNVRYIGKLKDLNKLELGILGEQGADVYNFEVAFPAEAGNEYQGLTAEVTFVLEAKEHPPQISGEIVWDPPLEKPDVHVRRGTVMPIKFHLVKDGTFDTVKRGLDLVITGVNDEGNPVEYFFSIVDGTLDWEEHGLNKPHYSLLFDTGQYPVKPDTYYTANVQYNGRILGQTLFKSGH